jgi:hypothetical protein
MSERMLCMLYTVHLTVLNVCVRIAPTDISCIGADTSHGATVPDMSVK